MYERCATVRNRARNQALASAQAARRARSRTVRPAHYPHSTLLRHSLGHGRVCLGLNSLRVAWRPRPQTTQSFTVCYGTVQRRAADSIRPVWAMSLTIASARRRVSLVGRPTRRRWGDPRCWRATAPAARGARRVTCPHPPWRSGPVFTRNVSVPRGRPASPHGPDASSCTHVAAAGRARSTSIVPSRPVPVSATRPRHRLSPLDRPGSGSSCR